LTHLPKTKLNFELDAEERSIIAKVESLSREEIWELL
jgi:hypothetical protein